MRCCLVALSHCRISDAIIKIKKVALQHYYFVCSHGSTHISNKDTAVLPDIGGLYFISIPMFQPTQIFPPTFGKAKCSTPCKGKKATDVSAATILEKPC